MGAGLGDWLKMRSAVRTVSGGVLFSVWQHINEEYLPGSGYQKAGIPTIESMLNGMRPLIFVMLKYGFRL